MKLLNVNITETSSHNIDYEFVFEDGSVSNIIRSSCGRNICESYNKFDPTDNETNETKIKLINSYFYSNNS